MTSTLTTTVSPSTDSSKDTEVKILKAQFGDGYSQRSADGLNAKRRKYNFIWKGLTQTQSDDLEAFLVARAGAEAFYFTPPNESTPILFTCEKWTQSTPAPGGLTLSAAFEEQFDLI